MTVATNAAMAAAEEAASGAWFTELQTGHLSKVHAPGMPHGVFGPWQEQGKLLHLYTSDWLLTRPCIALAPPLELAEEEHSLLEDISYFPSTATPEAQPHSSAFQMEMFLMIHLSVQKKGCLKTRSKTGQHCQEPMLCLILSLSVNRQMNQQWAIKQQR